MPTDDNEKARPAGAPQAAHATRSGSPSAAAAGPREADSLVTAPRSAYEAYDSDAPTRLAMPLRSPSPSHSAPPSAFTAPERRIATPLDDTPEPPLSYHDAAEPADPHEPREPLGPDDPLAPPFNPYKGNRGITRAWHALKNSIEGFRVAIHEESAFRQELTLAAILLPIGIVVPVEPVARVLLLGSVMLVLIVELINSSIENAIDRIGLERNELSRRAKDLGSAAVTVALAVCVMTWGLILVPLFGPPLLRWLGSL